MGGLAPLLLSVFTADIGAAVRRTRRNAIFYAVIAFFLLTAYVAGVVAGALYLAQVVGPPMAVLLIAIGALVLALIILATLMILNRRDRKRKAAAAVNDSGKALLATVALSALPMLTRSKPLMGIAAVGGLAFLLLRPRKRPLGGDSL
jgi:NADH:ubiquinone oxidoreductase subunit K